MVIGGPDAIGLGKPFALRFEPVQDLREPAQPELLAEPGPKMGESFDDLLGQAVDKVNGEHLKADEKVDGFLRGENISTHDVMIQLAKADTSLKLMTTVTNKVIEAYHEIARMQI